MRISPLCKYISAQLQTAVALYSPDGEIAEYYKPQEDFRDPVMEIPEISSYFLENSQNNSPVFFIINGTISYTHFATCDGTYIIGPFRLLFSDGDIYAKHTVTLPGLDTDIVSAVPEVFIHFALSNILLLYNVYQTEDLTVGEYLNLNFHTETIHRQAASQTVTTLFANRENQSMHNPYDQEMRLLDSIENGSPSQLKEVIGENVQGKLGTTAIDPVRNGKNMAIYIITAAGRAAVRGGLSAEYVFSLTDSYTQQIEELKDMVILQSIVENAEMNYARMVEQLKKDTLSAGLQEESPVIRRCKDYVFQHLHSKLTVQEIAEELCMNSNYLSTLFRRQEGISLYKYILIQKAELAKNLLTYSEYSYIEIANYLGFTSQSHLGAKFKSITGCTLKQYRDRYHKQEFTEKEDTP